MEVVEDERKPIDLKDDCKKCHLTCSEIRLCCNSDDGPCNPIIYNNGEKVNKSFGNCTVFVLKPSEKANLTFGFNVSDTVFKPVIKSCIVDTTGKLFINGNVLLLD